MNFEMNYFWEKTGEKIGYCFSYILFTIIFYFILKVSGRLPMQYPSISVIGITLGIVAIGICVRKIVK